MKLAIIGASGFVGSRVIEQFRTSAFAELIPVVRGVTSLSRLARYELDWRMADACDRSALTSALKGVDAVVHAVVGDPHVIEAAAAVLLPAAAEAGVQRVVFLSTASVHGQNPTAGTTEATPLSDRQEIEYNNAKVRAERTLFRDARLLPVELIVLRPSIVFGPRDRWVQTLASELAMGTAWLIEKGEGVCNTICVDNLVHAIRAALEAPASAAGEAYFVSDADEVSWRRFYEQTAGRLGYPLDTIREITAPVFKGPTLVERLDGLRASSAAQRLIAKVPTRLKGMAKGALKGMNPPALATPWQLASVSGPVPTREMVLLQQCRVRLPNDKARRLLNYEPVVTFDEGLDQTLSWMKWASS